MSKKLLIVESPSKAVTIQEYLGKDFEVVASKGHVRQLYSESGSVQIKNGLEFRWDTEEGKMRDIYKKLAGKSEILLATDPDREGEAIAEHLRNLIVQYLAKKKEEIKISRISFFEITKKAIIAALEKPRDIDSDLVKAYLTRVALDYSVGYQLSPQLWSKLRPLGRNQSAGRVQSSALKIIAQREREIMNFKKERSYSLEIIFLPGNITSTLTSYKKKKIDPKDNSFLETLKLPEEWKVVEIKQKKVSVSTPAPFITSSLQQEAANKLGMKIENTMKVAQALYEGVNIQNKRQTLITYMRTDSTNISNDALEAIRDFIKDNFPTLSVPPKKYASKVKNAQEAHECIRAIDVCITPKSIKEFLTKEQYELYELIWSRTISCQMKEALRNQTSIDIEAEDFICRANFSKIEDKGFLGFLREEEVEDNFPIIKEGDTIQKNSHKVIEHNTKPPARYNEATLIKQCEAHGIGRPSTYVPIINTLAKREYVKANKKSFEISFRGLMVYFFLEKFFSKYVDLSFTSKVEDMLDQIANGQLDFEKETIEFIKHLEQETQNVQGKESSEIIEGIESLYKTYSNIICPECNNEMKMNQYFSLECKSCGHKEKIGETVKKVGDFEITETDKCKVIKTQDRNIYMPQNFKEELNEEAVHFIMSLPRDLFEKNGEQVGCGMSKYGFYLKYLNNYYTIELSELMNLTPRELDALLEKKIAFKNRRKENIDINDKVQEVIQKFQTEHGTCEVISVEGSLILRSPMKLVYLPQSFTEELSLEKVEFILSLPKKMKEKDGKPVDAGVSKYGFFLKYNGVFYSFSLLELMSNNMHEFLEEKIKNKAKKTTSTFDKSSKKGFFKPKY